MTDEQLVRLAAKGDADAFALLVRRYENKVYSLALRICSHPEDAADAAQEAFVSAWRGLASFRGEAGFSTWLYRLAVNAAVDCTRRNRNRRSQASLDGADWGPEPVDRSPGPQERAEGAELRAAVAEGLRRLSDDHRQILVLRELRQLSYEEIASVLGLDLGTVKSRISRARAALRKILREDGNLSGYLPSNPTEQGRGRR